MWDILDRFFGTLGGHQPPALLKEKSQFLFNFCADVAGMLMSLCHVFYLSFSVYISEVFYQKGSMHVMSVLSR